MLTETKSKRNNFMKTLITRFSVDESGATAIEYALLASLISVVMIAAATSVGNNLAAVFNKIAANVK